MKVTQDHFNRLKNLIEPLDTPERRARYLSGDFPRADRVKDLAMRYRWDLYWEMDWAEPELKFELSDYRDTHLDTALRRIVPTLI